MSKKIIFRVFTVIFAIIIVALVVPSFINWNSYKTPLLELINKQTNFDIAIDGDIKLSLLPRPYLSVAQVSIKNQDDLQVKNAEPLAKLKQLSFAIDFLPLLSRKISIRSVELIEPVISVTKQTNDTKDSFSASVNLSGKNTNDSSSKNDKKGRQQSNKPKNEGSEALSLNITKASVVDGSVTLIDSKTNKKTEIKAINLSGGFSFTHGFDMKAGANIDGLQVNGTIKGGAFVNGFPSTLDAQCAVMQEKGMQGAVTLSGKHKDGAFLIKASSDAIKVPMKIQLGTQTIDLAKGVQFNVDATIRDKVATINTLKAKVADINLTGKGTFNTEKNVGSLGVALTSNILNATGTIGVDLSQAKPMVTADLVLPKVDDKAWTKTANTKTSPNAKSHHESAQKSSQERWSKDPIDLSALQSMNANVSLSIDKLSLNDIDAAKVKLHLILNNGLATIKQLSANVFDGGATVTGKLDSKSGQLTTDVKLVNMNVLKLPGVKGSALKAGTLNISAAITTKTTSMHAIINHLGGVANLDVGKTVVEGVDIKQFMADLKTTKDIGGLTKLKASFDRKADMGFNHVRGDVKLTNGVANTRNFEIDMNEGAIKSAGTVDLPNWKLALNSILTVRDVKNLPNLAINITGSIDQPQFALDMDQLQKALLQLAANQLADRAKDVVKKKVAEQLGGKANGKMADKVGGEAAKAIGKILPGLFG
ncbi:MAG: AsmA family protein [Alphaproteobacteria bacterium]|nr:AsmA family protein [Alphaproteobacteria bacterium]